MGAIADEKPKKKAERPPSQTQNAQQKKREANLAEFDRQLEEGTLVIRKMTKAERKANPPRDRPPKRKPTR